MRERIKWAQGIFFGMASGGWMFLIYWFSSQPAEESAALSGRLSYRIVSFFWNLFQIQSCEMNLEKTAQIMDLPIRKAAHMSEYALLSVLLAGFFTSWFLYRKAYAYTVLVSFLYACSDEIHQLYVEGRAGRIFDVCIDTLGAVLGILLVLLFRCMISKVSKNRKR